MTTADHKHVWSLMTVQVCVWVIVNSAVSSAFIYDLSEWMHVSDSVISVALDLAAFERLFTAWTQAFVTPPRDVTGSGFFSSNKVTTSQPGAAPQKKQSVLQCRHSPRYQTHTAMASCSSNEQRCWKFLFALSLRQPLPPLFSSQSTFMVPLPHHKKNLMFCKHIIGSLD